MTRSAELKKLGTRVMKEKQAAATAAAAAAKAAAEVLEDTATGTAGATSSAPPPSVQEPLPAVVIDGNAEIIEKCDKIWSTHIEPSGPDGEHVQEIFVSVKDKAALVTRRREVKEAAGFINGFLTLYDPLLKNLNNEIRTNIIPGFMHSEA